jgi:hypothetical protein
VLIERLEGLGLGANTATTITCAGAIAAAWIVSSTVETRGRILTMCGLGLMAEMIGRITRKAVRTLPSGFGGRN